MGVPDGKLPFAWLVARRKACRKVIGEYRMIRLFVSASAKIPGPRRWRPKAWFGALMLLCFAVPTLFPLPADAQQGRRISVIRDAEVEHIIASMAAPLLRFGGMSLNDVTLRVIVDDRLNAFATTGNRIFLNTGLILRTENVDQLRGVVAHEIGHLAGGHLLRVGDQIAQANTTALLGALAGLAAGVAAGRGDVATAVILGGNQAALRGFLAFTRTQENAADAFAMRALDA
ncbi:MAG: M48 family metallopeptidase, partial [Rhodospirillaceae bacterium]